MSSSVVEAAAAAASGTSPAAAAAAAAAHHHQSLMAKLVPYINQFASQSPLRKIIMVVGVVWSIVILLRILKKVITLILSPWAPAGPPHPRGFGGLSPAPALLSPGSDFFNSPLASPVVGGRGGPRAGSNSGPGLDTCSSYLTRRTQRRVVISSWGILLEGSPTAPTLIPSAIPLLRRLILSSDLSIVSVCSSKSQEDAVLRAFAQANLLVPIGVSSGASSNNLSSPSRLAVPLRTPSQSSTTTVLNASASSASFSSSTSSSSTSSTSTRGFGGVATDPFTPQALEAARLPAHRMLFCMTLLGKQAIVRHIEPALFVDTTESVVNALKPFIEQVVLVACDTASQGSAASDESKSSVAPVLTSSPSLTPVSTARVAKANSLEAYFHPPPPSTIANTAMSTPQVGAAPTTAVSAGSPFVRALRARSVSSANSPAPSSSSSSTPSSSSSSAAGPAGGPGTVAAGLGGQNPVPLDLRELEDVKQGESSSDQDGLRLRRPLGA